MKSLKIISAVAAVIFLTICAGVTAESNFIEGVDWRSQVITVTGEGIVPPDSVNYTQAKGMASKAAKADAYRKIGEYINGVRVEGETTVENMLTTQDTIRMRVEATIKGAKILDETFLSDGGYRVKMQVPLFGVSNSLASAVFERNYSLEPFPDPEFGIEPSVQNYNSSTGRLYQPRENPLPVPSYKSPLSRMALSTSSTDLQNLKASSLTPNYQPNPAQAMPKKSVEEYASMAQGNYTGLVVDCRGLELQPVMSPVIKNSNGTKIYGHKNLDIDRVIREGMADYVDQPENVARAGENPLVVKAQAVENFNSNPVVAIPDSNRILIENHATKFLKDLKVVFLFD